MSTFRPFWGTPSPKFSSKDFNHFGGLPPLKWSKDVEKVGFLDVNFSTILGDPPAPLPPNWSKDFNHLGDPPPMVEGLQPF